MNFKGTKGPWKDKEVTIYRQHNAGLCVSCLSTCNPQRQEEGFANARLIVAAPEMLDVLQDLLRSQILPEWHRNRVEEVVTKALEG